jgi:hypothetical protein
MTGNMTSNYCFCPAEWPIFLNPVVCRLKRALKFS